MTSPHEGGPPGGGPPEGGGAHLVEARGVLCPVPIIRLARAAAVLPAGTLIELITDDPVAEIDVRAWCHLRGHEWISTLPGPDGPVSRTEPSAPEPRVPNPHPGPVQRHVVRVVGPSQR